MISVGYTLWLITSAYATALGTYPTPLHCAQTLIQIVEFMDKPPRPVLAKVMCVPSVALVPAPPKPGYFM